MSRITRVQTNFSAGELDPLLRGRIDLEQYYQGLTTATNVYVLPQGGCKRRDGLKFLSEIPAAGAPQNGVRLIPFEFSTADSYMFALCNQRIYIFRNQALVTNINGSGNDYLAVTSITSAMLSSIRYAQSADTIILVHDDLPPLKIVRGGSHATWTASAITFTNNPRHAYTLATSNPAGTVTSDKVEGNVVLTASSSVFTADHVGQFVNNTITFGRARIVKFVSATVVHAVTEVAFFDTNAIANNDWSLETGYEASWSGSRGYPTSVTFHENRLWFGGSKGQPTTIWASTVGHYFDFELGEGLDSQSIEATIVSDSLNKVVDIYSGRDLQVFTIGGEFFIPQSSSTPITPSNMQVRVATRHGIKQGVPVSSLDSGTIFVQRKGKSLNELRFTDLELTYNTTTVSLLSSHMLQTPIDLAIRRATSTEEADRLYLVNEGDGTMACYSLLRAQEVIAPSRLQTFSGNFLAVGVDVDTVYTIVKRAIPLNATCTITVTDAANIAAGTTLTITTNDGVSTTFTATTSDPPADDLGFSVGGGRTNNGVADNIAVGHGGIKGINALSAFSAPNPAANVITVTRALAGGENLTVTSSDPTRIAVTNFVNGTTDKYYVETFDETLRTDSAVFSESAASTGSAAHLEKEILDVIVDDVVQAQKTVASGNVTFDRASATNFEIGIPITVTLKTMPVEPRLQSGSSRAFRKRILSISAELFETQSLTIQGYIVPFRRFGSAVLDVPVPEFTGQKSIGPLLGFSTEGTIEISQSAPLKMSLLGLDFQLSVGN